ncbi:MAG: hypothetical protein Q4C42_11775 [Clostridia bacterium]|nr:hypothetical protein [Clostridia bacterium]
MSNEIITRIREKTSYRSFLDLLEEEAAELIKASCKVKRAAFESDNPTPIEFAEARANLIEEAEDVCIVLMALGILPKRKEIRNHPKWERWDRRLKEMHGKGEQEDEM